jgi:hypothetical protein
VKILCLIFLWSLVVCYIQTLLASGKDAPSPPVLTECSIRRVQEPSGNVKFHVLTTLTRKDGSRSTEQYAQTDNQKDGFKRCVEWQKGIAKKFRTINP